MSKENSGFKTINLAEIPEGVVEADLYYPMGQPKKLVKVQNLGTELSACRKTQMLSRGIGFLWIHWSELQRMRLEAEVQAPELARCALDALFSADTITFERVLMKASLESVVRWVEHRKVKLSPAWDELSRLALTQENPTHATRVGLYATLFAMSFEHQDPLLLSDLFVAGMLHDVGRLCLKLNEEAYPEKSVEIVRRHAPEVSERARLWILQHHERFGGGGYPLGLEGYKVDDISQLLAAANLIDEHAHGTWEQPGLGLRGAFEAIESLDRLKTFPQHFNPEFFKVMLGWSRRTKWAAKSAAA